MKGEASWAVGVAAGVLVALCCIPFVPIIWFSSKLSD